jgi:hypothetical protein
MGFKVSPSVTFPNSTSLATSNQSSLVGSEFPFRVSKTPLEKPIRLRSVAPIGGLNFIVSTAFFMAVMEYGASASINIAAIWRASALSLIGVHITPL